MTALFSTRRRAEEFAAAVDGRNSVLTEELRDLVGVATSLRSQASRDASRPRDDFASDLRTRLMAEAEQVLVAGHAPLTLPVRHRGPRERRLVAAASVVVLFGGTAGMAAAAQQALPGDALYPIKRGLERAEAGLSVSPAGKGQDLLHQANDRLAEVQDLLAADSLTAAPRVPQTLDDFTAQAQEGSGLLMTAFEETRDPAAIRAVREFTAHGITLLQDLARTAPAESQDELATAALALSDIDRQATALCDSCVEGLPDLVVPGIFLASAEVERALALVDGRFQELDNSHPFIVGKRAASRTKESLGSATGSDSDSVDVDSTGPAPAPTEENVAPAPETPKLSLPGTGDLGLPGGDTSTSEGGPSTVDDTTGQITDGLTGVVETVLPDPLSAP